MRNMVFLNVPKNFNPVYTDESKLFFTSDTHFWHQNIIRFCNRPFKTVEEMNEALIANWNAVVPEDGIVFMLGDFCFAGAPKWREILSRLNGKIILIVGNHDRKNLTTDLVNKYFYAVLPQLQITVGNRSVYLNHYPFLCYGGVYRSPESAVWQLYGHVHSHEGSTGKDDMRVEAMTFPTQYDVGVDNNNYAPISWKEVKEKINVRIENEKNMVD